MTCTQLDNTAEGKWLQSSVTGLSRCPGPFMPADERRHPTPVHSGLMTPKQCMRRAGRQLAGRMMLFREGPGGVWLHVGTVVAVRVWIRVWFCTCQASGVQVDRAAVRARGEHRCAARQGGPLNGALVHCAIPAPPRAQVPGVHGAVAACKGSDWLRWFVCCAAAACPATPARVLRAHESLSTLLDCVGV